MKKYIVDNISVGAQPNLNLKQMGDFSCFYPTLIEQKKIANFLTQIDSKIDQLSKKKQLLERYKKAMMQKLFSQQLRFKDDEGNDYPDWVVKPLGDVMEESRVLGDKGDIAKKITVKLWGKGVFAKDEKILGSSNTQYYIRKQGQFIYSKLDFLNCAFGVIPKKLDGYQTTVDLPCFDIFNSFNSIFTLELVKQKKFYKKNGEIADGSRKAKRIHANTFLEMTTFFPSFEEQKKIANTLTELDKKINTVDTQLNHTKQFKKGLLQQMFV